MLHTIFQSLYEDTKITIKFPKRHICNKPCLEINTLLAFINKIEFRTSKELKDKGLNDEWFQSQTKPYYT